MEWRRRRNSFFRGTDSLSQDRGSKPWKPDEYENEGNEYDSENGERENEKGAADVNFVNNKKKSCNSAYVRVKVFRKPVIAKMLVDSGNLVNDLISAEFADLIKVPYTPTQKQKVGTASKNGSVSIIGQCRPFKIFLENLPKPLTIQPFVVKELSHPINVGRNFLGRYKGKLEFSPDHGFLEVKGQKVKLISKTDELLSDVVTDARIRKVIKMPHGHSYSTPDMVKEGMLNSIQEGTFAEIPIFAKSRVEVPAMSG